MKNKPRAHSDTNAKRHHRRGQFLILQLNRGPGPRWVPKEIRRQFPSASLWHIFDFGRTIELAYYPTRKSAAFREVTRWRRQTPPPPSQLVGGLGNEDR